MIDRALAIIGIALALIFGLAPYWVHRMPVWLSQAGAALGIFLIGLAAGLFASSQRTNIGPPQSVLVDNAELRLHIYGDERQPTRIAATNIWRWYYLRNMFIEVDTKTGQQRRTTVPILFVTFDVPVRVGTFEVQSPDIRLPSYEAKEFNNRYAIITFYSDLSAGTLEIIVHQ